MKNRKVTPRMAEANQKNAQNSTGPRTPEGKRRVRYNAVKHGLYGQPCMDFMVAVHENPAEYRQIRAGYKQSFHPFTDAQEMLVDDLAMLRWVRRRNQRSQAASINVKMEKLDTNSEDLRKQYDRDGMGFKRAEVVEKGIAGMPDCPSKFEQMLKSLRLLLDQVERKEFHTDASPTLQLLYGNQPSLRANSFFICFQRFLTEKPNAIEYEQLRGDLFDEQKEWNEHYQFYLRRKVEISRARRNLCFAPTEGKWRLILRQEAMVDRQMERKTRLLWEMPDRDWKRRHDEEWQQFIREESEDEEEDTTDLIGGPEGADPEAKAREVAAEQAKATEQAEAAADPPISKNSKQSRQAIENKGAAPENKAEGQGSGTRGQGSGTGGQGSAEGDGSGSSGQEADEGDSNRAQEPPKA